jgi:hypothetical protein
MRLTSVQLSRHSTAIGIIHATVVFCTVFFCPSAAVRAFDVEGYQTGMSKAAVMAKATPFYNISSIQASNDTLIASSRTNAGDYLSFNFCQDRLVGIQQGYPANLRQTSLLISDFNTNYGQPFSIKAASRPDPTGEVYELGVWWKAGAEFASVYFLGSTQGDSLSSSHQAVNDCFRVPR